MFYKPSVIIFPTLRQNSNSRYVQAQHNKQTPLAELNASIEVQTKGYLQRSNKLLQKCGTFPISTTATALALRTWFQMYSSQSVFQCDSFLSQLQSSTMFHPSDGLGCGLRCGRQHHPVNESGNGGNVQCGFDQSRFLCWREILQQITDILACMSPVLPKLLVIEPSASAVQWSEHPRSSEVRSACLVWHACTHCRHSET